ncbi:MAG: flagellar FliJ family protein [Firmicutes bacterium]|nr:flagellar FliJ family protein [Bacillota bacterium]
MKKFRFPLETVLDYKHQILDALLGEHARIRATVTAQEELILHLELQHMECGREYDEKSREGLSMTEVLLFQNQLNALKRDQKAAEIRLAELKKLEAAKLAEVVEAKKEVASIEKLKEKRLKEYNRMVNKNEETLIDEFVTTERVKEFANSAAE